MARVSARSPSWKPGAAWTMPTFVSAGSVRTSATSPWESSRSRAARSLNSTTRVVSAGLTGGPRLPRRGLDPSVHERGERLVDRAVVAPVEDEHLRPPGDVAREPDREAVRVGGRERELPGRQAEAPGELLRHPERIIGRQHRRDAPGRLRRDRSQRRRRGVAAHGARVAEAEVDDLVAVDVGEAAARSLLHEQREPARPLRHPVHRHAREQVSPRTHGELGRARMLGGEPRFLACDELGKALVHARYRSAHAVDQAVPDTSTTVAPPSTGSSAPLT